MGARDWMKVLSFDFFLDTKFMGFLAKGMISSFVHCVGEVMRWLQCVTLGSSLALWQLVLIMLPIGVEIRSIL